MGWTPETEKSKHNTDVAKKRTKAEESYEELMKKTRLDTYNQALLNNYLYNQLAQRGTGAIRGIEDFIGGDYTNAINEARGYLSNAQRGLEQQRGLTDDVRRRYLKTVLPQFETTMGTGFAPGQREIMERSVNETANRSARDESAAMRARFGTNSDAPSGALMFALGNVDRNRAENVSRGMGEIQQYGANTRNQFNLAAPQMYSAANAFNTAGAQTDIQRAALGMQGAELSNALLSAKGQIPGMYFGVLPNFDLGRGLSGLANMRPGFTDAARSEFKQANPYTMAAFNAGMGFLTGGLSGLGQNMFGGLSGGAPGIGQISSFGMPPMGMPPIYQTVPNAYGGFTLGLPQNYMALGGPGK